MTTHDGQGMLKACRETMLRGALETCAKTFRRYGELHRMKGTTEGNLKASNNDDLAEFCESVLADTRTAQPSVATEGEVERVLADCAEFFSDIDGALATRCETALSQARSAWGSVIDLIRARAKQRPSDGLIGRQGITEDAIRYGQALLNALADEIETRAAIAAQVTK